MNNMCFMSRSKIYINIPLKNCSGIKPFSFNALLIRIKHRETLIYSS